MMQAPPIKVRDDRLSWAINTEDALANTTSDSITTEVTPEGRRAAPNCKAQLPTISSTDITSAMPSQLVLTSGKLGTRPSELDTRAVTSPMLMQPANMASMRAWLGMV